GAEFLTRGRGETGQRRLPRRIGAAVGQWEARQQRSDHDDAAASSPAHAGKDALAQAHAPKTSVRNRRPMAAPGSSSNGRGRLSPALLMSTSTSPSSSASASGPSGSDRSSRR